MPSCWFENNTMLTNYIPILILLLISTALALIVIALSFLMGPRRPSGRKASPYESGMMPIGQAMRRFPAKFYLIAVLFILFDIEVIFLYPWAIVFRKLKVFGLIEMAIFIIILLVGYVYVWKRGALEWE